MLANCSVLTSQRAVAERRPRRRSRSRPARVPFPAAPRSIGRKRVNGSGPWPPARSAAVRRARRGSRSSVAAAEPERVHQLAAHAQVAVQREHRRRARSSRRSRPAQAPGLRASFCSISPGDGTLVLGRQRGAAAPGAASASGGGSTARRARPARLRARAAARRSARVRLQGAGCGGRRLRGCRLRRCRLRGRGLRRCGLRWRLAPAAGRLRERQRGARAARSTTGDRKATTHVVVLLARVPELSAA